MGGAAGAGDAGGPDGAGRACLGADLDSGDAAAGGAESNVVLHADAVDRR